MTTSTESNNGSQILKWVFGIVTALIIAVLSWWLTSDWGPLAPSPQADVAIFGFPTEISINVETIDTLLSMNTKLPVEVYNSGKAAAEQCYVQWTFPPGWDIRVTDYFGIAPEETRSVVLDLYSLQQLIISEGVPWPSNQRYALQTEARLICDSVISRVYQSTLTVYPLTP